MNHGELPHAQRDPGVSTPPVRTATPDSPLPRPSPRAASTPVFAGWSLALGRPTLADRFFERGIVSDAFLIIAGAALTAILAQAVVPLWPVPSTGQTLGVLLVGGALGAVRATLSMLLYLGMGAAGLPVLSGGASGLEYLTGPTAGYLCGFVVAAALTGWMAQRSWDHRVTRVLTSFIAASVIILIMGVGWLSLGGGRSAIDAIYLGAIILLPGTVLKSIVATIIMALGWRAVEKEDRRRATDDLAVRN